MAVLTFTLSEEGVSVFHDALACIVKFSEDVVLEARKDKVGDDPRLIPSSPSHISSLLHCN